MTRRNFMKASLVLASSTLFGLTGCEEETDPLEGTEYFKLCMLVTEEYVKKQGFDSADAAVETLENFIKEYVAVIVSEQFLVYSSAKNAVKDHLVVEVLAKPDKIKELMHDMIFIQNIGMNVYTKDNYQLNGGTDHFDN